MKVAISAGHYPKRPGACYEGTCEHELALEYVDALVSKPFTYIQWVRVPVGTLPEKVNFINKQNVDLAIEVHFNACGNCGASGSETLYYPGSKIGRYYAYFVQSYLCQAFPPDRGIKAGWYRMDRPGVIDYDGDVEGDEIPDYFLRKTNCPALIVEPEFIHNLDVIKSKKDDFVEAITDALADINKNLLEK